MCTLSPASCSMEQRLPVNDLAAECLVQASASRAMFIHFEPSDTPRQTTICLINPSFRQANTLTNSVSSDEMPDDVTSITAALLALLLSHGVTMCERVVVNRFQIRL